MARLRLRLFLVYLLAVLLNNLNHLSRHNLDFCILSSLLLFNVLFRFFQDTFDTKLLDLFTTLFFLSDPYFLHHPIYTHQLELHKFIFTPKIYNVSLELSPYPRLCSFPPNHAL